MLYHGSICGDLTVIEPRSRLHGDGRSVAYWTDSRAYALFYLWDGRRNHNPQKYVTGGIRDGAAFYEEQFPDQLRVFYQGVSGWLYTAAEETVHPLPDRPRLFYAEKALPVREAVYVSDVYEALLACEAAGTLRVLRFAEQTEARQQELTHMIAAWLRQQRLFADDAVQRAFMKRYFSEAWTLAENAHSKTSV